MTTEFDDGARLPDSLPEQMTTREAVDFAKRLHLNGAVQQALEVYRRVIEIEPEFADAWHFCGILEMQLGQQDEGIRRIRHCLTLAPDYAAAHANLGMILRTRGELADAERHLLRATELDPKATEPRMSYALLRRMQGHPEEALELLKDLLREDEDNPFVNRTVSSLLQTLGRLDEAIPHFWKAQEIDPDTRIISIRLGYALARMGRMDEARHHMQRWIELSPDDPQPRHLLAAYGGAPPPPRAGDGMVRETFNAFAPSFESKLAALDYRAPQLIEAAVQQYCHPATASLDLLDAGCGTGLLGQRVRSISRRLVGVDLSAGMLDLARKRALYDELVEGELTAYTAAQHDRFDVIASADTLCYFGELDAFLDAARSALRAGGWLLFSLEHAVDREDGYMLQIHGRYAHAQAYAERALRVAGFAETHIARDTLRMEAATPVAGLIVAARKAPSPAP